MVPGVNAQVNLSLAYVSGDSWGGIPGISITVNGIAPAQDVRFAWMQFRQNAANAEYLVELSSEDGTISITSTDAWTFVVPAQNLNTPTGPLLPGTYVWGFRTEDVNGVKQTYLSGTMEVLDRPVTQSM